MAPTSQSACSSLLSHRALVPWVKCNHLNLEATSNNRSEMFEDLVDAHITLEVKQSCLITPLCDWPLMFVLLDENNQYWYYKGIETDYDKWCPNVYY